MNQNSNRENINRFIIIKNNFIKIKIILNLKNYLNKNWLKDFDKIVSNY